MKPGRENRARRNRCQTPIFLGSRFRCLTPISQTPVFQRGFTYIALLIGVAIIGGVLAAIGELASHAQQREKESELLFAGDQIRAAIGAYYERSPGGAKAYPKTLEDLLEDKRWPVVQRYLRKVYRDPMTGKSEWGVVEGPGGGIMGVYSKSEARPLRSGNLPRGDESFADAKAYTEWKFTHSPLGLVPAQPETPKQ